MLEISESHQLSWLDFSSYVHHWIRLASNLTNHQGLKPLVSQESKQVNEEEKKPISKDQSCTLEIRAFSLHLLDDHHHWAIFIYFHRGALLGLVYTFALLRPPSRHPTPLCWTHEGISLPHEPLLGGPLVLFILKNGRHFCLSYPDPRLSFNSDHPMLSWVSMNT